jgi:hypothetical protein
LRPQSPPCAVQSCFALRARPIIENHPEAYSELTSFEIHGYTPMIRLMIVLLVQKRYRIRDR